MEVARGMMMKSTMAMIVRYITWRLRFHRKMLKEKKTFGQKKDGKILKFLIFYGQTGHDINIFAPL